MEHIMESQQALFTMGMTSATKMQMSTGLKQNINTKQGTTMVTDGPKTAGIRGANLSNMKMVMGGNAAPVVGLKANTQMSAGAPIIRPNRAAQIDMSAGSKFTNVTSWGKTSSVGGTFDSGSYAQQMTNIRNKTS